MKKVSQSSCSINDNPENCAALQTMYNNFMQKGKLIKQASCESEDNSTSAAKQHVTGVTPRMRKTR